MFLEIPLILTEHHLMLCDVTSWLMKQNKTKYKWIFRAALANLWETCQRWYATMFWMTCLHSSQPITILKSTTYSHIIWGTVREWGSYVVSRASKICARMGHAFLSFAEATKTAEEQVPSATGLDVGKGGDFPPPFFFCLRGSVTCQSS